VGELLILLLPNGLRSEVEKIVHWMSEILFAAEIVFGGLDGGVPQQELDLLQFTAAVVTQFRAGSPQVMRGNALQSGFFTAGSDDVPDNILGDAPAPYFSQSGDGSKDSLHSHPMGNSWHHDVATVSKVPPVFF